HVEREAVKQDAIAIEEVDASEIDESGFPAARVHRVQRAQDAVHDEQRAPAEGGFDAVGVELALHDLEVATEGELFQFDILRELPTGAQREAIEHGPKRVREVN